ncbi:hypothetical protein [Streptomyces spiralis]|nr:hypothetical protein [Streptomyces spiralis]
MTERYGPLAEVTADPALYERLITERNGQPSKILAERTRPGPPPPTPPRRPVTMRPAYTAKPDPDAAEHFADLQEAIGVTVTRPAPAATTKRTPPAPGMTWCNSCDGWCTPQGICGCNNS